MADFVIEVDVRPGCPHCYRMMGLLEAMQARLAAEGIVVELVYNEMDHAVVDEGVRRVSRFHEPERRSALSELASSPRLPPEARAVASRALVTPYLKVRRSGWPIGFAIHIVPVGGDPRELVERLEGFLRHLVE